MPLEFESLSHGTVPFGFFNIETDMILLDHYFFFAKDFCHAVSIVAQNQSHGVFKTSLDVYAIEQRDRIGNLMRAIHGIDYRGFIGEVYRRFPFPVRRDDFRQKTEGSTRRMEMEDLVGQFAARTSIEIVADQKKDRIAVGDFVFSRLCFQELINYLWEGGYPRWKDEFRPDYVLSMKKAMESSKSFVSDGLTFVS